MERNRRVIFFKHYFRDFFEKQNDKVQEKIDYVLFLITVADRIPQKFLKHIEGIAGLYEIRIEYQSNIYRIFCCFDEGNVMVLFNGFQKKSHKAPPIEIERALRIKKEYFHEKSKAGKKENG